MKIRSRYVWTKGFSIPRGVTVHAVLALFCQLPQPSILHKPYGSAFQTVVLRTTGCMQRNLGNIFLNIQIYKH